MKCRWWSRSYLQRKRARRELSTQLNDLDVVGELRSAVLSRNDRFSSSVLERFEFFLEDAVSIPVSEISKLMANALGLLTAQDRIYDSPSRFLAAVDLANAVGLAGIELPPSELARISWHLRVIVGLP